MADENPTQSPPETPTELPEKQSIPEPISVTETDTPLEPIHQEKQLVEGKEEAAPVAETPQNVPQSQGSFKEESNKVTDLSDLQKKSLDDLKTQVQDLGETQIYGVPLLQDERSDVILLKFLRARDFKVKEAFVMLKNTLKWRQEFGKRQRGIDAPQRRSKVGKHQENDNEEIPLNEGEQSTPQTSMPTDVLINMMNERFNSLEREVRAMRGVHHYGRHAEIIDTFEEQKIRRDRAHFTQMRIARSGSPERLHSPSASRDIAIE